MNKSRQPLPIRGEVNLCGASTIVLPNSSPSPDRRCSWRAVLPLSYRWNSHRRSVGSCHRSARRQSPTYTRTTGDWR